MGVYLGGGQAGMSQHLLDAAQISSSAEQVGREGMPHGVRRQAVVDAGAATGLFEHLANGIGGEAIPTGGHEEELR